MKKLIKMKTQYYLILVLVATLTVSCSFDEELDPNGPSLAGVEAGASVRQLNEIAIGIEATSRDGHGIETTVSGSMARELYLFDADPRNTGNVLGKGGTVLDNNSFYSTTQFAGNYRTIKNANVLLEALDNTKVIEESEKNLYRGYAKTFQAYELIQVLKSYGKARIDVADDENLGPFLEFDAAIAAVRALLDDALNDLNTSESLGQFSFPVSGFGNLIDTSSETPENGRDDDESVIVSEFSLFNRAIAAVAAVYAGDGTGALTALEDSFFNLNGELNIGVKHVFSQGAGDQLNGVFRAPSKSADEPNNGDQIIVHNSWINDAEVNSITGLIDERVTAKTAVRPAPSIQDGLTGSHETRLYSNNVAPIDMIRNEELILIYAEASILANSLTDAQTALDIIRMKAGGLGPKDYGTPSPTAEQLTAEMLFQRRYSLWAENHRLFDTRRYDLTSTLPLDREGDRRFSVLPIPLAENQ